MTTTRRSRESELARNDRARWKIYKLLEERGACQGEQQRAETYGGGAEVLAFLFYGQLWSNRPSAVTVDRGKPPRRSEGFVR